MQTLSLGTGYNSCNNRFRTVDNVGNASEWTSIYHIHMDTEAPVHTNWWWGEVTKDVARLYIQATDSASGIARVTAPTSTQSGGYNNWVWFDAVWDAGANAYRADITPATFGHYEQTYITHLYIWDNAGNGGKYNETSVNIPTANSATPSQSPTHTATSIPCTWDEISQIAKIISNTPSITNDTAEVTVTLNGKTITLGVGDTATVDEKTVRILGFNHDPLTNATAYGNATATGMAGISFEYVDFVISNSRINPNNTNSGGWAAMPLRTTLNGTVYSSLSIKSYIKEVNKEYIITYNTGAKSTCSDKLWLLSCGEIWNNGYNGGNTRGYAAATEGSQYKYYKTNLGSTAYNSPTYVTKKPNISDPYYWWLRSPVYGNSEDFCLINHVSNCNNSNAGNGLGVAPGFSI